jgi:hypothetical protein
MMTDRLGSLPHRRARNGGVALLVGAIAYAVLASFTRAFTSAADVVVAIPLAGAVAIFALRLRTPRSAHPDDAQEVPGRFARRSLPWFALVVMVVGWELFTYASTPRHDHPTLSSVIDIVDSNHVGKAIVFLLWLILGWYLLQ